MLVSDRVTTVFITGINGQDGTLLARRLLAEGVRVHGLVRPHDHDDALAGLPAEVTLHIGDLSDPQGVERVLAQVEPDCIYNLGGISSVGFSWDEPVLTGAVTGLGAVAVMEAAQRLQDRRGTPVRVLQASSSEIFGTPDRTPQDESTRIRPISPYGAAKAYAHEMARVFRSRGLHVTTCILYNHESTLRPPTFVTRKITQAVAGIALDGHGTLTIGDVSVRRDWGWAPDFVDALVRALAHDEPDDFVVATGETHSVEDFVEAAFAAAGVEDWHSYVEIDPALVRPADAAEMVGDASKAHRLLGWAPTVTFDGLVARMVEHDLGLLRVGT